MTSSAAWRFKALGSLSQETERERERAVKGGARAERTVCVRVSRSEVGRRGIMMAMTRRADGCRWKPFRWVARLGPQGVQVALACFLGLLFYVIRWSTVPIRASV